MGVDRGNKGVASALRNCVPEACQEKLEPMLSFLPCLLDSDRL